MAAPLPLPALHATHAGIWIASAARTTCARRAGARRSRAPPRRRTSSSTRRWSGSGSAIPNLSGLDLLELFAFVHPARFAVPTVARAGARAWASSRRASEAEAAAALTARSPTALARVLDDADWREREGAWTSTPRSHRLRLGLGAADRRRGWSGPSAASACCSRGCQQWEEAADRPPPRTIVGRSRRTRGPSSTALTGRGPSRARASGDGRGGRRRSSRRSARRMRPTCCSPRPAPGSARRSPISRPRRCGRSRRGGDGVDLDLHQGAAAAARRARAAAVRRCGGARARRSSSARAARIISACSTSRTRCRAPSPGARRSSRSWSDAGRPIPRTATWSAATCRAGCRACSAAPARPR